MLLLQPIYEMQLGADRPFAARRRLLDGADDFARRARDIRQLKHLARAFRMDEDFDAGMLLAEHLHVLGPKHLVHAAMAFPQNDLATLDLLFAAASQRLGMRIPNGHLVERDSHPDRGVAPEMLIGKEHHAACARERPAKSGFGI